MRLLAYERWMADAVAGRQAVVRTRRVLWTERYFGGPGIELLAAAMMSVVVGELIGIAGIVGLAVLTTVRVAAAALIGLAVVVLVLGAVRFAQAIRLGRAFRGSRPAGDQ
jgi:hypothetical protein